MGRFFDHGNYDEAYVSRDFATAYRKRFKRPVDTFDASYSPDVDYLLGFFDSYEDHEVPEEWRDIVIWERAEEEDNEEEVEEV